MVNIHGTLVSYGGKGILFIGESASGKSDLALRMIMQYKAKLVADDRVDINVVKNKLIGSAPSTIAGKIEVRGVGIAQMKYLKKEKILLCVELCSSRDEVERLPNECFETICGVKIAKIKLFAFDCSTICKIIAKISGIIS